MKLLDRLRQALRLRHYSPRTEVAYVRWVRRFIRFHGNRHPAELGATDIAAFLTNLAASASTQNQALAAIVFLYRVVLDQRMGGIEGVARAQRPRRMPCVLTRAEVRAVLLRMRGVDRLVAGLLYGSGLHLLEALQLRVKDVDFQRREILVRRGKGAKDRITVLADAQRLPLARYLDGLRERFEQLRTAVALPDALRKKYPNAEREWVWRWVFPGRGGRFRSWSRVCNWSIARTSRTVVRSSGCALKCPPVNAPTSSQSRLRIPVGPILSDSTTRGNNCINS